MTKSNDTGNTPVLPTKPSVLLRLAISDMERLDRDKYVPSGDHWHVPMYSEFEDAFGNTRFGMACAICLAGAVMAGTLEVDINKHFEVSNWKESNNVDQLNALNYLRMGLIADALQILGFDSHDKYDLPEDIKIEHYEFSNWDDADKFLGEMDHLAGMLEREGI